MVQLKLTNFKTGKKFNPRSEYNLNNLTPTQKMNLTYCRIWGTQIGDNIRSGNKIIKNQKYIGNENVFTGAIPRDHQPWLEDHYVENIKIEQNADRRERILMRGVKIGQRKGGDTTGKFSIFNTKKDTNKMI